MQYVEPANYPNIFLTNLDTNPTLISPNATYTLPFAFDKEQSYDLEEYKSLIDASIREFRHSRTYKHYKSYLYSLGLDRCMFHSDIRSSDDEGNSMASLEMHHCILTIYDISCLICEHFLNLGHQITEFDLSELLRIEHTENRIPIVMLCKDCHSLYHHKYLYVHPDMIFGKWWELVDRYKMGLTRDLAWKLMIYLDQSLNNRYQSKITHNEKLLKLRDNIKNWSQI